MSHLTMLEAALTATSRTDPPLRQALGRLSGEVWLGTEAEQGALWLAGEVHQIPDLGERAQALVDTLGPTTGARLHLMDTPGLGELSQELLWQRTLRRAEVAQALEAAGMGSLSRGVDRLLAKLRHDRLSRVGVSVATPGAEPQVLLEIDQEVLGSERTTWVGQLNHTARFLGASRRQRDWFQRTGEALLPRPAQLVSTRITLTPRGLAPRITATFYDIPERIGLLLFKQISGDPSTATRLGALSAAAGGGELLRLRITLRSDEPPGVGVELGPVPDPQ